MSQLAKLRHSVGHRLKNFLFNEKLKNVYDFYEDFIGIKEVRKTQEAVLKSESEFVESSQARRGLQDELIGLQQQIKQVRHKLDSTHRSDEAFLDLITKEHQMIKSEIKLIDSFRKLEETERHLFERFSQKLRDAHEVERLRQEKTKYLSVIGSVVGACLGIIGTSINYGFKKRDFNKMLQLIEMHNSDLNRAAETKLNQSEDQQTISSDLSQPIMASKTSMQSMQTQTEAIKGETIVETILNTESNLEYKMKVNTLATVVLTYALIAVTLPLILKVFGE